MADLEFIKNYFLSFGFLFTIDEVKEQMEKCLDVCQTCEELTQCASKDCKKCPIEMKSFCFDCELIGLKNPDRKKLFDLRLSKRCFYFVQRKILLDAIVGFTLNVNDFL